VLAAVADVEAPEQDLEAARGAAVTSHGGAAGWQQLVDQRQQELLACLKQAAVKGKDTGAASCSSSGPGDSGNSQPEAGSGATGAAGQADTDRDGRCKGACSLLSISLPLWRVAFRDVKLFSGMMYAFMASRVYNTTVVQVSWLSGCTTPHQCR
jgi:hypothetical protein